MNPKGGLPRPFKFNLKDKAELLVQLSVGDAEMLKKLTPGKAEVLEKLSEGNVEVVKHLTNEKGELLKQPMKKHVEALEGRITWILRDRAAIEKPSVIRDRRKAQAGRLEKIFLELDCWSSGHVPEKFGLQRFDDLLRGLADLAWAIKEANRTERWWEIHEASTGKPNPQLKGGPRPKNDEKYLAHLAREMIVAIRPESTAKRQKTFTNQVLMLCLRPLMPPRPAENEKARNERIVERAESLLSKTSKVTPLRGT